MREVVDALDAAFYAAFGNVEPTGKRLLLALDVSGSMAGGVVAGVPGLTPRDASAALALVTAATEAALRDRRLLRGPRRLEGRSQAARLVPRRRRPDAAGDLAAAAAGRRGQGGVGPAVRRHRLRPADALRAGAGEEVDAFVIYTDSETWAVTSIPAQALATYRRASGIDARLVVVGMVSNGFSIADPNDAGMLDVVGFDTATPQLIADFARGAV